MHAEPRPSSVPPRRVLVVDDLPEICALFHRVMRHMQGLNVQVVTEVNAARALDLLSRDSFDLVISDFRMPAADGIEVLTRANEVNPGGRRILITGYNEVAADIERIRGAKIDIYLQKPVHDQDLVLILRDAITNNVDALAEHRRHARAVEARAEDET